MAGGLGEMVLSSASPPRYSRLSGRLRRGTNVASMNHQDCHDGRTDHKQGPGLGSTTDHGGDDQDGKKIEAVKTLSGSHRGPFKTGNEKQKTVMGWWAIAPSIFVGVIETRSPSSSTEPAVVG